MKIGVLGGTFDPVHLGHIMMAEEARKSLGLSEVLLVPAGQPMTRSNERITSVEHRLRMLRLAAGPSFTVDTITELRRKYGGKDEIFFILGWDSLAQLPIWREPARIVKMCILVAVPRPGWPQPSLKALEKDIPGIAKRVVFLEKPRVDISATAIREKVAGGESIDHLVPGPVADYIKKHGLYRAEQEVK
jgi:nicotinate-nucleotide adenylyltransferase